ncbi:MAG: 50S ribosomal protein L23 [Bacilli bacterium]|jgi:large subunit ribosomal protein L23|nr:50S ribosomal protein L23 [Bacilli bacterium]NLN80832.1 50S ribosomal protein L23 [Erysipelotrichia bacterium]
MAAKKTTSKKAKKVEKVIARATIQDFDTIISPVITEKTMTLMQEQNKATFKVQPNANKTQVKIAFERIFNVKATDIKIINVLPQKTSRGGRYKGTIPGFKKAIITVAEGEALDLFKE